MGNHACVAIGINHYQFLPPLNYGQADAHALWQFLVNQADLPSNSCLLLTETSPLVNNQSTHPTQDNIWRSIEAQEPISWHSENWRWFFFCGYGVSWAGVDYLLPIDADPKNIPGTGIPARSLLASLKSHGDENLLVLLDINRAPGLQAGAPVGREIVEIAHQMGITLILSSQLDQFSHEAAALGHGLFTKALLEALYHYHTDITLADLEQYLRDRLPELSQHHWRPIQTPLMVTPSNIDKRQLILPTAFPSSVYEPELMPSPVTFIPKPQLEAEETYEGNSTNGTVSLQQKGNVSTVATGADTSFISTNPVTSNPPASIPSAMVPYTSRQSERPPNQTAWWRLLLLWGGLVLLALMIAAVVLRNREAFTNKQASETPALSKAPTLPQNTAPANNGKVASPRSLNSERLQANQAALDRARRLLRPNQASLFNKAIVEARSVKPGDPLYQQAQEDIQRWSAVILDLAEGRAKEGNFKGAIAAAKLVPNDDSSTSAKARAAMNQWNVLALQQQQNQKIIQSAKKQLQPNQASSYSRSITTLRQILPSQPGYAEAQQLITQWSRTIYLIAQSRAAQGNLQQAIQTAALVPANTASSDAARRAIAKWKQSQR
ncbi:MAG TPA: caspase family protein [Coleofasciculaceae cyanobacterium]